MSEFRDLSARFEDYRWCADDNHVNREFYRMFSQVNGEMLEDISYDNIVLDPSVVVQSLENTEWVTDFYLNGETDTLESIYGKDMAQRYKPGTEPRFMDRENYSEIYSALDSLKNSGADIWYPDHMEDCLRGKRNELEREVRSSMSTAEADHWANEFEAMEENIVSTLEAEAYSLPVKEAMGVKSYTRNGFHSKWSSYTEDDFIIKMSENLGGNTVTATFDSDYIGKNIAAFPPTLLLNLQS